MALTKKYESRIGITLPNAYLRISRVDMNMSVFLGSSVAIHVETFATQSARQSGKNPIESNTYQCGSGPSILPTEEGQEAVSYYDQYFSTAALKVEGVNIISQAYQYLKTTHQVFQDATDC